MKTKLKKLAELLEKVAVSFEEYKQEHPGTQKTKSDPMFTDSGKHIDAQHHGDWEPEDHQQASQKHAQLAQHHAGKSSGNGNYLDDHYHDAKSSYHEEQSRRHADLAKGVEPDERKYSKSFRDHITNKLGGYADEKGDFHEGMKGEKHDGKVREHLMEKHEKEKGAKPTPNLFGSDEKTHEDMLKLSPEEHRKRQNAEKDNAFDNRDKMTEEERKNRYQKAALHGAYSTHLRKKQEGWPAQGEMDSALKEAHRHLGQGTLSDDMVRTLDHNRLRGSGELNNHFHIRDDD